MHSKRFKTRNKFSAKYPNTLVFCLKSVLYCTYTYKYRWSVNRDLETWKSSKEETSFECFLVNFIHRCVPVVKKNMQIVITQQIYNFSTWVDFEGQMQYVDIPVKVPFHDILVQIVDLVFFVCTKKTTLFEKNKIKMLYRLSVWFFPWNNEVIEN